MVILGVASIIETVFVLRLFHKPDDEPIPKAVVRFSSFIRLRKTTMTWKLVAKAVDKFMFIVFLMTASVMVLISYLLLLTGHVE